MHHFLADFIYIGTLKSDKKLVRDDNKLKLTVSEYNLKEFDMDMSFLLALLPERVVY